MYQHQQQQSALEHLSLTGTICAHEAQASDLQTVNRIVSESIASWGLAERVRRLATPCLHYKEPDLRHMTIVVLSVAQGKNVGVAAWEETHPANTSRHTSGSLLHGLYVLPGHQRRGIGARFIELLAQRTRAANGDGIAVRACRDSVEFFLSRGFEQAPSEGSTDTYPLRLWKSVQ